MDVPIDSQAVGCPLVSLMAAIDSFGLRCLRLHRERGCRIFDSNSGSTLVLGHSRTYHSWDYSLRNDGVNPFERILFSSTASSNRLFKCLSLRMCGWKVAYRSKSGWSINLSNTRTAAVSVAQVLFHLRSRRNLCHLRYPFFDWQQSSHVRWVRITVHASCIHHFPTLKSSIAQFACK